MSRHTAKRDQRRIEDLQDAADAAWRAYFELRNAYADVYAAFMRAKDEADRADMALIDALNAPDESNREGSEP